MPAQAASMLRSWVVLSKPLTQLLPRLIQAPLSISAYGTAGDKLSRPGRAIELDWLSYFQEARQPSVGQPAANLTLFAQRARPIGQRLMCVPPDCRSFKQDDFSVVVLGRCARPVVVHVKSWPEFIAEVIWTGFFAFGRDLGPTFLMPFGPQLRELPSNLLKGLGPSYRFFGMIIFALAERRATLVACRVPGVL